MNNSCREYRNCRHDSVLFDFAVDVKLLCLISVFTAAYISFIGLCQIIKVGLTILHIFHV